MANGNYPFRFEPFFQNYLWGGRNLATRLGKRLPPDGVWAESWEIIDHPHHQSIIINGRFAGQSLGELIRREPARILGPGMQPGGRLPLLLKYLDCQQVLSVQVHPSDAYAQKMNPPDFGKTEAWYIVDSQPGAVLYAGLQSGVTPGDLLTALESGSVEECLHRIEPRAGDCIFVPAGTVHALGAGLLVAEIQQSSNTTFRLYDWNRRGPDGQPRPLHIKQALEVIDFDSGPRCIQAAEATDQPGRNRLVGCQQFCLDRLVGDELLGNSSDIEIPLGQDGRFHLVTVPVGEVELIGGDFQERLTCGQSALLPAALNDCRLRFQPSSILLDMYVADDS